MQVPANTTPNAAPLTRVINLIVVHCSATQSGKRLAEGIAPTVVIDRWHQARGFCRQAAARVGFNPELQAIGYHYVVDLDGRVWTGRGLNEVGAHVEGFNANSVGICMVGGAEREGRYTLAQWDALHALVHDLVALLPGVPLVHAHPISVGVCGHRDLSPDANHDGVIEPYEWLKTCPGFDVAGWLDRGMLPDAAHMIDGAL